jgi:hypothetical protein
MNSAPCRPGSEHHAPVTGIRYSAPSEAGRIVGAANDVGNGRRARSAQCPAAVVRSFVCASATAACLVKSDATDVTFVATGAHGLAEEDVACAELIAAVLGAPSITVRISS